MEKLNINTKVYTLDEVYSNFNHSKTFSNLLGLKEIHEELEDQIDLLVDNLHTMTTSDQRKAFQLIEDIETQIFYLRRNIRVFEDALLCHETKVYEVRYILGQNTRLWLN